jgi:hypothetical protein
MALGKTCPLKGLMYFCIVLLFCFALLFTSPPQLPKQSWDLEWLEGILPAWLHGFNHWVKWFC